MIYHDIPPGNQTWQYMAIEHTLFIGDCPIQTCIDGGFSIAMFDYQRVSRVYGIENGDLPSGND